jgi:hypothetical protein
MRVERLAFHISVDSPSLDVADVDVSEFRMIEPAYLIEGQTRAQLLERDLLQLTKQIRVGGDDLKEDLALHLQDLAGLDRHDVRYPLLVLHHQANLPKVRAIL